MLTDKAGKIRFNKIVNCPKTNNSVYNFSTTWTIPIGIDEGLFLHFLNFDGFKGTR